jgi:hypothetical protein
MIDSCRRAGQNKHLISLCRVPHFAVLLSVLNRSHVTAVEAIVLEAGARLNEALAQRGGAAPGFGPSANMNAAVILRLLCSLAQLGVVATGSLLTQLRAVVDCAAQIAADVDPAADYRTWQPYSDFLVEAVLLALPWGGGALRDSDGALEGLLDAVDGYLARRKCSVRASGFRGIHSMFAVRPVLCRFCCGSRATCAAWLHLASCRSSDALLMSSVNRCAQFSAELAPWSPSDAASLPRADASAASFLPAAVAAVRAHLGDATARCRVIAAPQAAVDHSYNESAVYDAPALVVPEAPPVATGEFTLASAVVRAAYPPRGVLPLLPPHVARAPDAVSPLDVILLQESMLHALHCYAANGTAVVEEITGLLTPFPAVPLLVELLISQMLLPAPALMVFGYQSLLVRLVETLGQPLAMCVPARACC